MKPANRSELETPLQLANNLCDSDLLEFAMALDVEGRLLLAERQARWAKQLRASAAVLECLAAES